MQYTRLLFVCCYYSFVCLFISGGENKAEKKEQVLDFRKATFQEICANNEKKVWGRYQDFFWRMPLILLVCIKKGRNIKILWIPCKDFFSFQVFLSTSIDEPAEIFAQHKLFQTFIFRTSHSYALSSFLWLIGLYLSIFYNELEKLLWL